MPSPDHVFVVLPYRNREKTLERAAMSVLSQTHSDLTLLLVNDASTDDSAAVARGLQDSRVRHVDLPAQSGVCGARNAGLDAAEGELVAFMDSDDYWLEDKLSLQVGTLRRAQSADPRVGAVGGGWRIEGREPRRQFVGGPFDWDDVFNERVAGISTQMLVIDRNVVGDSPRFDPSFPAQVERDFVLSCLAGGRRLVIEPKVLGVLRRGMGDHVANKRAVATAYERMLDKYGPELEDRPLTRSWYHYRALRAHLIAGNVGRWRAHLRPALRYQPIRRSVHLLAAAVARKRGLAVAERVIPQARLP